MWRNCDTKKKVHSQKLSKEKTHNHLHFSQEDSFLPVVSSCCIQEKNKKETQQKKIKILCFCNHMKRQRRQKNYINTEKVGRLWVSSLSTETTKIFLLRKFCFFRFCSNFKKINKFVVSFWKNLGVFFVDFFLYNILFVYFRIFSI